MGDKTVSGLPRVQPTIGDALQREFFYICMDEALQRDRRDGSEPHDRMANQIAQRCAEAVRKYFA